MFRMPIDSAIEGSSGLRTADFLYELPEELIAQRPAQQRDQSRLLVLDRTTETIEHRTFRQLPSCLQPGDVLVVNDSRVIPARLRAEHEQTGGEFELLLLSGQAGQTEVWSMMRPAKRAQIGTRLVIKDRTGARTRVSATVIAQNREGHRLLRFENIRSVLDDLAHLGETPLPPYIKRGTPNTDTEDAERYQTVYAAARGSVAAPTAGLHFTPGLLNRIEALGVRLCPVTLHVGYGTFAPVKADRLEQHVMHEESFLIPAGTAREVNAAKSEGRRVVAVGTTTVRALESVAAARDGLVASGPGCTDLFIHPPFRFRVVDALVTNFHLPCSTLLMLVSAFVSPGDTRGRNRILAAYAEAVRQRYRFFSYGDAMLIQ